MVTPGNSQDSNQVKLKTEKSSNKIFEALSIEVILLFFGTLIVLLILNYFSIIPLTKKFPDIFGFLPTKNKAQVTQVAQNSIAKSENGKVDSEVNVVQELFACPVRPQCTDGKGLYDKKEKRVKGLGYIHLDKKTRLFAIIDGKVNISTKDSDSGRKINVITTENDEFIVTYEFSGTLNSEMKTGQLIHQDDIIGEFDGNVFTPVDFATQTYSLYITVEDVRSDQIIPLIPKEDKPGLRFY